MKKLSAIALLLITAGCSVQHQTQTNIDDVKKDMQVGALNPPHKNENAVYVNRPPIDLTVTSQINKPSWTYNTVPAIMASGMPFSVVANAIAQAGGASVQFGDVDANKSVRVMIPAGATVDSAISALASASGYTPDIQDGVVVWRDMVVRTYDLNTTIGKTKFSMGKSGDSNSSSSSGSAGSGAASVINSMNDSSSQYNNVSADYDLIDDAVKTLQAIVGKTGTVTGSPAAGLISVQGKGNSIQLADSYMKKLQASIRRQVQIQIKLLTFQSKRGSNYGIDWNLIYKAGDGNVAFDTQNMGGFSSETAPSKISVTASGGHLDGSQFIVDALQEQGDVAVVTSPSANLINNRVGEIEVVEKTQYTQSVKVTPNQDSDPTTETVLGAYNEGYTLFALPKITDDGEVFLHVSSELSSLVKMDSQEINEITQKNPTISNSRFTQTMRLRTGETWVINGYKQSLNKNNGKTTVGIPLLGGQETSSTNTVETIVLITPTIIN